MRASANRIVLLLSLPVLLFAGCDSGATISGQVSFDGQPVEQGWITLLSADGQTAAAGGAIEAGHYHIENVPLGEKVVQVVASPKLIEQPRTIEGMEQQAREISRSGVIPQDVGGIGPNTPGNGVQVEVIEGEQKLDVELQPEAN